VQAYLDAPQEPKATITGVPPAAWPASGDLKIESLSARYSEARVPVRIAGRSAVLIALKDGPDVLKDLSLHVKSGERVGIGDVSEVLSSQRFSHSCRSRKDGLWQVHFDPGTPACHRQ
jgi:ABC-type multidrug transport system fused ATPase/permease subunit